MKTQSLALLSLCVSSLTSQAVTTLPVGPITFSSDADYDNNFKEGSTGSLRRITDSLRVSSIDASAVGVGSAIYDTSVTPGSGGNGGTGGTDANNDLSNFTVSSLIQFQNRGTQATAGYFLRMDGNEAGGYLATATFYNTSGTLQVRFDLFRNVDLNFNPAASNLAVHPTAAFSQGLNFTTSAAANFNFSVTAIGSEFTFQITNPANASTVSTTFNDTGTTILSGQTGVFIRAQAQASGSTSRMDDFMITEPIPEPSSVLLLGSAVSLLALRRRKA